MSTEEIQVRLTKEGVDPADVSLEILRAGEGCGSPYGPYGASEPLLARWRNDTWWQPRSGDQQHPRVRGGNSMSLAVAATGSAAPCRVCVSADTSWVSLPCMDSLREWEGGFCFYAGLDCPAGEENRVYSTPDAPEFLHVDGVVFPPRDITDGPCADGRCGIAIDWANTLVSGGVTLVRGGSFYTWTAPPTLLHAPMCHPHIVFYAALGVTFNPCQWVGDAAGILTVAFNIGSSSGSLGAGTDWQYFLHAYGSPKKSLLEQVTLHKLRISTAADECYDNPFGDLPATITATPLA